MVILLLLAPAIFFARGALGNQTSISTQYSGGSLLTLAPSNSSSHSFVESGTADGFARLGSNGSAVIITPSNSLPDEGYYPKRAFVSYDLTAPAGTVYTVFLFTKYDGRTLLFGGNPAFVHGASSSSIGTIVDFVGGEYHNATEPLSSLSSILTDGQIAVIFVPLQSSSFGSLKIESVQTTWGLLPFGSSGFLNQSVSNTELTVAATSMLIFSTAIPGLVSLLVWRRSRNKWLTPRRVSILFLAAAAIRFGLAPVTGINDTDNFAASSSAYFSSGVFGVDWVSLPGFLYVELVSYFPYALLRNLGFVDWTVLAHSTFAVETVFVKMPSILSDLGIGLLLAKFAERFRPDLKGLVLVLYLFNPLTVYLSGVYGQFDTVFVLLLLASVYSYFVLRKTLLTGLLLGATSLVNPVGFVLWIALFFFGTRPGGFRPLLTSYAVGAITFLAGLAPVLSQSNSVLQTTFERLMSAYPGDIVVGTVYKFTAFGQVHYSSEGYGLTFRFLLELFGQSAGYYLYPVTAAVAFLAFTILMFETKRRGAKPAILSSLAYCLGSVALFELFFPTIFLQFVLWPLALLFCAYAIAGDNRYLSLASITSLLTGVLYLVLVDQPFNRATGVGSELLSDLGIVNAVWAMLGLVYSALMLYTVILSINAVRRAREVTALEYQ